jgi:hypothetical protein
MRMPTGVTALDKPGRSSVRITGDDYQWRIVWGSCLAMLHDTAVGATNPIVAVGVEVDGAGNVDDVVLYRQQPPDRHTQVKWAVDWKTPVGLEWLSRQKRTEQPLLAKLAASRRLLHDRGVPFEMSLLTNRAPDPADVLIAGRDARTGLLTPAAAENGPKSAKGEARTAWAKAAGVDEAELVELLGVLEIEYAHDSKQTNAALSTAMTAVGLRSDEQSVQAGADWVAEQVRSSQRRLTVDDVAAGIDRLELRAGQVWKTVSIATLKPDPLAKQATVALDWVDRFDGADQWRRRRPLAPASWEQLQADIAELPMRVDTGDGILVTGSLRQATGFAVGAAFRRVAGFDIAVRQGSQLWHSLEMYDPVDVKVGEVEELREGAGDGLAVVVQVARPASGAVRDWVIAAGLPIRSLVAIEPAGGISDQAIGDAATALAFAVAVRNTVSDLARGHDRIHLFLAGPLGISVLLGQRWNRVKATTVYEDLVDDGYAPAFHTSA